MSQYFSGSFHRICALAYAPLLTPKYEKPESKGCGVKLLRVIDSESIDVEPPILTLPETVISETEKGPVTVDDPLRNILPFKSVRPFATNAPVLVVPVVVKLPPLTLEVTTNVPPTVSLPIIITPLLTLKSAVCTNPDDTTLPVITFFVTCTFDSTFASPRTRR